MAKDDKIGSHNLSRGEMKEIHRKQLMQEEPDMIPANGKEANGYQIKAAEKGFVHVEMELANFDQSTGQRLSTPYVQTFSPKEFLFAKEYGGFSGYKTKILHSPENETVDLGSSAEGARKVDSNFAYMQERYEALTGEKAPEDFTENQLNAAILIADKMHTAYMARLQSGNQAPPAPIQEQEVQTFQKPLVVGTPAQMAIAAANGTEPDSQESIAEAAKQVAENTAPTGDGSTSVGQETEPAKEADAKEAEAKGLVSTEAGNSDMKDKEEVKVPAAAQGRRGAAPAPK
jgi:hypothetical protein